jgi:predicted phosphodiesterase
MAKRRKSESESEGEDVEEEKGGETNLTDSKILIKHLSKKDVRLKFKHLKTLTGFSDERLGAAIAEARKDYPNLVFAKFDRTFYLSDMPTWYSHHTDLSAKMPKEGVFGVITDTHIGSVAERLDILNYAYERFEEVGIKEVFHLGDVTDGFKSYPGHMQFVKVYGANPQVIRTIETYPKKKGVTTYMIAGNHDMDSYKLDKVDRLGLIVTGLWDEGRRINGREDIVYCGQYSHNIVLPEQVVVHLIHPQGGKAYALSYNQQKRSEAMDRNLRPDLQLSGHFHSYNHCFINHTHFISCFGLQDETEFFKRRGMSRGVGFLLIWYKIREGKFLYLRPEVHAF